MVRLLKTLVVSFLLFPLLALGQSSTSTPNVGLKIPAFGSLEDRLILGYDLNQLDLYLSGNTATAPTTWKSTTSYASGQLVLFLGNLYSSLINGNQGNVPSTSPSDWSTSIVSNPGTAALLNQTGSQTFSGPVTTPILQGELNGALYASPEVAVNAACSSGLAVYFPAGVYTVTTGIALCNNLHIRGVSGSFFSANGTIFRLASGAAIWGIYNPNAGNTSGGGAVNGVQNAEIRNVTIDISQDSAALGGIQFKGVDWSQTYGVNIVINNQIAEVMDGSNVAQNNGAFFNDQYSLNIDDTASNSTGTGIYVTGEANDNKWYGGSVQFTGTSVLIDNGNNNQFIGMGLEDWQTNCIHLTTSNTEYNEFHRTRCEAPGTGTTNVSVQIDAGPYNNIMGVLTLCSACTLGVDTNPGYNSWEHTNIGTFALTPYATGRKQVDIFGTSGASDFVGINKIPAFANSYAGGGLDVHGDIQTDRALLLGQFGSPGGANYTELHSLSTGQETINIPDAPNGGSLVLVGAPVVAAPLGTAISGTNYNSVYVQWQASYFNGTAAVIDQFLCLNQIATGTAPAAQLVCSHQGAVTEGTLTWNNVNWLFQNETAATSSTNTAAPSQTFVGLYWNGSASTGDTWRVTPTFGGTGANPTSSINWTHTGSLGAAYVQFPNVNVPLGGTYETTHGSNATAGVATLASGTVTVSTTVIAALAAAGGAGDVVQLSLQSCSSCGVLSVGTVTAGTSFVINSTNVADASSVYWEIKKLN